MSSSMYTRKEVSLHSTSEDCWIIISGKVYNVTQWLDRHPGGKDILQYYGGQDTTIAFHSFHKDMKEAMKYLKVYCIGEIIKEERELSAIEKDFMKLRHKLIQQGLFKPLPHYFIIQYLMALSLEIIAAAILYTSNTSCWAWILAIVSVVISTLCGLALSHDSGHNTFLKSTPLSKVVHYLSCGVLLGYSASWWKWHHNLHHGKTNVYEKDPYITGGELVAFGTIIPKKWGKERKGLLPYQYQHYYATIFLSFTFLPLHYNIAGSIFALKTRSWKDILCIGLFWLRWLILFSTVLDGILNAFLFYLIVKIISNIWWTAITLTNHTPMEVEPEDKEVDWITLHISSSCNVKSNWFTDFFMVLLTFHIEHHLFPTMPTYNNRYAQPHVKALCQKYNIDYQVKPFFQAFKDIIKSLKRSGEIWWEEYQLAQMTVSTETKY